MNWARKRISRRIGKRSLLAATLVVSVGAVAASAQQGQAVGQATYTVEQAVV